jgi:hypothetical protein
VKANFVAVAVKNSLWSLQQIVPALGHEVPKARHYEHVCLLYRRIGTGLLLMSGDPEGLYENLHKSSQAYLHFLEVAAPSERLTSRAVPFFDAVACRNVSGAERIARASPDRANEGREYEEDFLYMRTLMERFYLNAPADLLEERLARFEELSPDDPRLQLCRSLIGADQEEFDEALELCIADKAERLALSEAEERLHPDDAPTVACVSTEVLAWLELAEQTGLSTVGEHRFAPSVARRYDRVRVLPEDSWRTSIGT